MYCRVCAFHFDRLQPGHTTVRLKVEQNQFVDVFGEIGIGVDGLKDA